MNYSKIYNGLNIYIDENAKSFYIVYKDHGAIIYPKDKFNLDSAIEDYFNSKLSK